VDDVELTVSESHSAEPSALAG
jgi:hypothetical protein